MRMIDDGMSMFDTVIIIDAMSVFPSGNRPRSEGAGREGPPFTCQIPPERLDRCELSRIRQADTRDTNSDGHTKDSISRDAILAAMAGEFNHKHAYKDWQTRIRYDAEGKTRESTEAVKLYQKHHPASASDGNHPFRTS